MQESTEQDVATLPQAGVNEEIQKLIQEIWADVFKTANKILTAHMNFGFTEIAPNLDPSLDAVVRGLKTIETVLDSLDNGPLLDYEERRLVINSKQQINNVISVALCLESGKKHDYDKAIEVLKNQAPF